MAAKTARRPVDLRPLGTSKEVATYLGVSVRTLDDWAHRKTGPEFIKVGKHRRYRWEAVEDYLVENTEDTHQT